MADQSVHSTERRFHGPYLAGAPCKPVVRRHAMPGMIPEYWLNFRIGDDPVGALEHATPSGAIRGFRNRNRLHLSLKRRMEHKWEKR